MKQKKVDEKTKEIKYGLKRVFDAEIGARSDNIETQCKYTHTHTGE